MDITKEAGYAVEQQPESADRLRILQIFSLITIAGVIIGVYLALFYTGTDVTQGEVQRIFYIHVAAFAGAFVAFGAGVIGGGMYLYSRKAKWDALALAGVEVGFTMSVINLVTGMVWARPIWNTWWTWDPRLTSAAIMVLTYAAYLMLRGSIENPERRRRFASVYSILAISTVLFTFVIIRVRPDTIHPTVIGSSPQNEAQGGFAMGDTMVTALGVNSFVWTVLLAPALIWWRIRLQSAADRVEALKARLSE